MNTTDNPNTGNPNTDQAATASQPPFPVGILAQLESVSIAPECEAAIEEIRHNTQGSIVWRFRKAAEARDLFALSEISSRMTVLALQAETELRALIRLRTLVPCLPAGETELVIRREVDLVLSYPEAILHKPLPGYALVEILKPRDVFMPNVSFGVPQLLCLGANVPRNYPLREAVLGSYSAICMQTVTVDERDTAGVMNGVSARWWQLNSHRMPLSKEPFLGPQDQPDEPKNTNSSQHSSEQNGGTS